MTKIRLVCGGLYPILIGLFRDVTDQGGGKCPPLPRRNFDNDETWQEYSRFLLSLTTNLL